MYKEIIFGIFVLILVYLFIGKSKSATNSADIISSLTGGFSRSIKTLQGN